MSIELKIPDVGESIREIQIGRWLKQEGEVVAQDEDLVELETDKASMELPAPAAGVLAKILKKQGDTVGVGDVIGYLEKDGAATEDNVPASAGEAEPEATVKKKVQAATAPPAEEKKGERKKSDAKDTKEPRDKTGGTPTIATSEKQEQEPATLAEKVPVTPAARRALRDHGLSAAEIEAKGPRIHRKDVLRYVEEHRDKKPAGDKSELEVVEEAPKKDVEQAAGELEEVVPMSLIRRHIAERLVQAQQQAALLTTFNEIDMSGVKELRAAYRDRFQEKYDVKLGYMSFFVKAVVDALKGQPELNAEIRDRNIVYRHYHHIGIAIGSAKGLVVPVLRFAERLSFAEIEQAIDDFSRRAAENELEPQELEGGTFTITNGGVYGSLLSTPIVNPPQSGILGMHAIQDRPVARNGQVVIRPMMYVALTYDHRLVDGRQAVTFLTRIKDAIEDPSRMLLEV